MPMVALLAEGVDRNLTSPLLLGLTGRVALLAEGVDRNTNRTKNVNNIQRSPSSRRAWIEIQLPQGKVSMRRKVALLAEGVDRNSKVVGAWS